MIDSVMPSCCSRMTAPVELATHFTAPGIIVEIGTSSAIVKKFVRSCLFSYNNLVKFVAHNTASK